MALSDTTTAIGAVSQLLRAQLLDRTEASAVDVGRPETASGSGGPKYNLFLYQVDVDGFLRNQPLDEGQQAPLWLVLRYLLTAFDTGADSDSTGAHDLLGEGMLALRELNFLHPTGAPLADNPQPLKITFDPADVELLSKIMQGSEEHYRLSVAFQVRPVMIAPSVPPAYAPLVLTVGPPGNEGVTVLPTLGPRLSAVEPQTFEAGDTLTLNGEDLTDAVQWVCFGAVCYPVTAAPPGRLRTVVPANTTLSAGSYAITVARELPSGRRLSSNAVLGHLAPTLTGAAPGVLTDDGSGNRFGDLVLSGARLGGPDDSIFVAFYREGEVRLMMEGAGLAAQTTLTVSVAEEDALPVGTYRVMLRVNGVQASATPEVSWQ